MQFPKWLDGNLYMHMYMEKYQVRQGVKISQAPYDSENQIISLPLYSLEGFLRKYNRFAQS
jgi:hypothetical protein